MTHVPRPPVKITPAVFQCCSIIVSAANENRGACGEETRQTKRGKKKRKASWTEIPAGLLYTYTSSSLFPSDSEVDPLPTHTLDEIFEAQSPQRGSHGFSVAIQSGHLPELLRTGVLWVKPNKDASWTHRIWVGKWAPFCNSILPKQSCQATLPSL